MISPVKIWRNQKKIKKILGKKGKIVSYTEIFVPPKGFEAQAPYVIVVVKFSPLLSYTAQLIDFEKKDLKIGREVRAVLRKTKDPGTEGVIPYGIKFKPV